MDSAGHTVLLLDVQLGKSVFYKMSPKQTKLYDHTQKHREYLSGTKRRQYFSLGNASQPYPTLITPEQKKHTFPTQR